MSFALAGMPAHGVARALSNRFGTMIRSGYHCAQPMHEAFGMPETARASVHLYNTTEEIDAFVQAVSVLSRLS